MKLLDDYRFPEEVKMMACEGVFTLFVNKDKSRLVARDREYCEIWVYSGKNGDFLGKYPYKEFDMNSFHRLSIVDDSQIENLKKHGAKLIKEWQGVK